MILEDSNFVAEFYIELQKQRIFDLFGITDYNASILQTIRGCDRELTNLEIEFVKFAQNNFKDTENATFNDLFDVIRKHICSNC